MRIPGSATLVEQALASIDARAQNDLRTFASVYLSHHFQVTEKENEHPEWQVRPGWGPPQQATADTLSQFVQRAPQYRQHTNLIIEIFRGAGKSTLGVVALSLWLLCTGRRRFIVILSDTATQAVDQLAAVLTELEENTALRARYGALYVEQRSGSKTERKRQNDVTLLNGARIIARGAGQKLRGTKWGAQRPDCVVMDDPQGEEQAESAEQMEKRCRWIERVAFGMGALNTLFILIATPLRHNDVIARVASKPATHHVRFPCFNSDGSPADPFRFPAARLAYLKAQMGPTAFQQEMQLIPAGEEQKPFRSEWMRAWPAASTRLEDGAAVVGWDPKAKAKEEGDYFAACGVRCMDGENIVVERCIAARVPMYEQAQLVCMLAVKLGARTIVVETIAAQEWATVELRRVLREMNYEATILGQEHNNDKRVFLEKTLQVPIFNGHIKFAMNAEVDALRKELSEFPFGAYDDRCDALANAYLGTLHARRGLRLPERLERLTSHLQAFAELKR